METYFKANPNALKYCNAPPAFLDLLKRLFNGVLATGDYARIINKAIKSCIDPKLLAADASQASDLAEEEGEEENKDNIGEGSKLELA